MIKRFIKGFAAAFISVIVVMGLGKWIVYWVDKDVAGGGTAHCLFMGIGIPFCLIIGILYSFAE